MILMVRTIPNDSYGESHTKFVIHYVATGKVSELQSNSKSLGLINVENAYDTVRRLTADNSIKL
jgi:hypothetical protein